MTMKFIEITKVILFTFCIYPLFGQFGIQLNSEEAEESYTLFETGFRTYLIDNCGEILNEWDLRNTDNHSKLMPNGDLIYIKDNEVIIRDWDDNIIKRTGYDNPNIILEYEVIVLPSGNYLCLGREVLDFDDFVELGYNLTVGFPRFMDVVVEIDPNTERIVWLWNIKDHMIQERNNTLNNYGIVADSPRKLNMDTISTYDWLNTETFMLNGFDYNPELDLIALSVRKMSEVVIIDHSTTTSEAATSSGGNYGHGGDILFRWGNPRNYKRGSFSDRELYYQHNPNWIEHGEHKGKLMIFNNGLSARFYSSVEIIDPQIDSNGDFVLPPSSPFQLSSALISYNVTTTGTLFSSGYTSGAKVLPNGNIFVTEGQSGRLFEMTQNGDIVWEYIIEDAFYIFRSEKYPISYSAFEGKDLEPQGVVENDPSTYACDLYTSSYDIIKQNYLDVTVTQNINHLIVQSKEQEAFDLSIYNMNGQLISKLASNDLHTVNKSILHQGQYILQMTSENKFGAKSVFVH